MSVFEYQSNNTDALKSLYKYKNKLKNNRIFLISNVISISKITDKTFYTLEETGTNTLA